MDWKHCDVNGDPNNCQLGRGSHFAGQDLIEEKIRQIRPPGAKQRSADDLGGLTLIGVRLYSPVLGRFNGVDGRVGGEGWLVLHTVGKLAEVQALYGELDHLSGWLIIGTDRGGEAFVLDDDGQVLVAP